MTPDLQSLHSWLATCLPGTASEIMADLQVGHRQMADAYKGLPRDAAELSAALLALERQGLLERRDGAWRWLYKAEKQTQERTLFV